LQHSARGLGPGADVGGVSPVPVAMSAVPKTQKLSGMSRAHAALRCAHTRGGESQARVQWAVRALCRRREYPTRLQLGGAQRSGRGGSAAAQVGGTALQHVALRCNTLRCVATRCAALQHVALRCGATRFAAWQQIALRCNTLRCVATRCAALRCNTFRGVATGCAALQQIALRCTATQCAALQQNAMRCVATGCAANDRAVVETA